MSAQSIKMALYALKRQYGKKVILKQIATKTTDYVTGAVVKTETAYTVRKAIVLPRSISLLTNPLISGYLLQSKGGYDVNSRYVIIDGKDIRGVAINLQETLTKGTDVYKINSFEATMDNHGYLIKMRRLEA